MIITLRETLNTKKHFYSGVNKRLRFSINFYTISIPPFTNPRYKITELTLKMTPKAQQLGTYDLPSDCQSDFKEKAKHQRNPSSTSSVLANVDTSPSTSNLSLSLMVLNNLSNRVTSVINPAVIFFVATPIAMTYPLLQFIMFLTILVGTSPLYFIMITFVGKSDKHNNSHYIQGQNQPHRRQPSIVGSIAELNNDSKDKTTTTGKTR